LPGEAEGARQVEVAFENHYSRHDTAVSHSEYVRWSLRGDCTPEPSSQWLDRRRSQPRAASASPLV